jgi:sulfate adenylyltransferase subunit 1
MEQIALPIVMTGHIDHGKSTLIGRLLYDTGVLKEDRYQEILVTSSALGKETEFAFVLDALEEERSRGITIDTTQIYFQTPKRKYVIIDAPGHKEFLRNMITGASYAEAAVLIIDANEGIRDQTKRHAYLLSLVGIREICVVINKMDLVAFSQDIFNETVKGIRQFFAPLGIIPRWFIPISALSGINVTRRDPSISWYEGPALTEALDEFEHRAFEKRPLRLPIQDVYEIDGEVVAAGRVESGEIAAGMEVVLLPGQQKVRIKEVKKYLKPETIRAAYGDSIGVTIEEPVSMRRGFVLAGGDNATVSSLFEANLFWFFGEYRLGDRIEIKCTTQESPATITIQEKFDPATMDRKTDEGDRLEIGEVARVTVKTENPLVVDDFAYIPETGRFIMEKDGIPVAGGIIIS